MIFIIDSLGMDNSNKGKSLLDEMREVLRRQGMQQKLCIVTGLGDIDWCFIHFQFFYRVKFDFFYHYAKRIH